MKRQKTVRKEKETKALLANCTLQRTAIRSTPAHAMPSTVHEVLHSPGQALDPDTRSSMETRLRWDFSHVRVHADMKAADSARALNARAYAVGNDVVFGAGQYVPDTRDGQRLLAHELTHVIQQGGSSTVQPNHGIDPIDGPSEREADHVANQVANGGARDNLVRASSAHLQRKPDVGFVVHSLNRDRGNLDDPSDDGAGSISWPLSFSVTSPLEASADVEVTGSAADPCASHQVGFLQTVRSNWLNAYYWGQSSGHGSTIIGHRAPVPIRDGEPGTMWYLSSGVETPGACNTHVQPRMDDYPTIFQLPKVHMNTVTGQPNYLTGVRRGISFVTTLVASEPGGVHPLRFFYWNYQMNIDFRPNHATPNAAWPFTWNTNKANLGRVLTGQDPSVPLFTIPSPPYNSSIAQTTNERR